MAVMLPPQVTSVTESDAERYIFRKLKEELPDSDWIVLHSLGLISHDRKPWAEIDFVIIGPPGVFCLEVKGGTIGRTNLVWTTTTRSGHTSELKESPFAQVGSAAAALHSYLREVVPAIKRSVTGYGVLFPDVTFRIFGPDIESQVLFDARDTSLPMASFLKRVAGYWHDRSLRDWGRTVELLSVEQRKTIRDSIARDFNLCASLRVEIGQINDQLIRLTEEQQRVFSGLTDNDRVLISGGAGTGKTLLAVAEAKRLAECGLRVLFLCYNRCLAEHLRLSLSAYPLISTQHLHGFMAGVVGRAGLSSRLPDAEPGALFEVFYPELCLEALLDGREGAFDALIIDESQDLLLESYLDVMDAALVGGITQGRWRAFLDPKQNIYGAMGVKTLERINAVNPTRYKLSINCRNTIAIATAASLLSGIPGDAVLSAEGPDVVYTWYRDRSDQRRAVSDSVRQLLHRGLRASEMVILSPFRLENSCLVDGLISSPLPAKMQERPDCPSERAVPFWTIASFKGLEADAVLLIDLDDLKDQRNLLSIYVGASRSRALLHVFLNENQKEAYAALAYQYGVNAIHSDRWAKI